MSEFFSVAIVGAGPAALATILGMPNLSSTIVFSGEELAGANVTKLHPKILQQSANEAKKPGVCDEILFKECTSGSLANTASVGGLANYWGQQATRYRKNDPWPKHIFAGHSDYLKTLDKIEDYFCISGGSAGFYIDDVYSMSDSRLLIGNRNATENIFKSSLNKLINDHDIMVSKKAVLKWRKSGNHFTLTLSDGKEIKTKRIILAAGVIGSLRLSMQSCPEIHSVRLKDHSPTVLYFVRGENWPELQRQDFHEHYNRVTIEKISQNTTQMFASVYQVSKMPLSLLLATAGLPAMLHQYSIPKLFDFLCPIQFWSSSCSVQYEIKKNDEKAEVSETSSLDDEELRLFCELLGKKGRILYQSKTPPGFGFHYHAGEVSLPDGQFVPLHQFLTKSFDGRITVVDASQLFEIGSQPHTMTAMAASYKVAQTIEL